MLAAASGLARNGLLNRYHTPIGVSTRQVDLLARYSVRPFRALYRELARRRLPTDIPEHCVVRTAALSDVMRVAMTRARFVSAADRTAWGYRHAARFDRGVAKSLRPGDGTVLAVAGAPTRRTLRQARALDLVSVLDFPLPHHAAAIATLRTEAQLVPAYADTLQLVSGNDPDWLASEIHEQAVMADHLLLLSSYALQTFVEAGIPEAKMSVVPLGVDTALFQPHPRTADGVFRVLFVGQITQRKGVSYLVEAFQAAAIPDAELVLAGAIIGSTPWANVANVRHEPPRPRSELPALYAAADVVVLPSLVEGFGLTALEGLASARPVIVSEHTFGTDVIDDGVQGWTVPIRDADAITDRLRLLASDPSVRARMGRAARARAEELTWHRYGARISERLASLT